jgi:carboxyl-terminal processing protease
VRLHVTVRNIGPGKAPDAIAQLRNLSGDGLFVNKGRFQLGVIEPGQSKTMDFTFDVKPELESEQFRVELSVYDEVLHEYVQDKLSFPTRPPVVTATRSGDIEVQAQAQVLAGAARTEPVVGVAKRGAIFKATGTAGEFVRVELDGRPGYLPKTAVKDTSASPTLAAFSQNWQVSPPNLSVNDPAGLVYGDKLKLSGKAHDENKVSDIFIFVSNRRAKIDRRKVFYRSNRDGQAGTAGKELAFDADIPLWQGANVITVVARESTSVQSQQTIIVERNGGTSVAQHEGVSAEAQPKR